MSATGKSSEILRFEASDKLREKFERSGMKPGEFSRTYKLAPNKVTLIKSGGAFAVMSLDKMIDTLEALGVSTSLEFS